MGEVKNRSQRKSKNPMTYIGDGSLTLLQTKILKLLDARLYPSQIARKLGVKKQNVWYHLNKFERAGLITRDFRSSFIRYRINILPEQVKNFSLGVRSQNIRLHNVCIRFPIVKDSPIPLKKKVNLRNWTKYFDKFGNCTVEKTTKALIIYPEKREGKNAFELYGRAMSDAQQIAQELCDKYGIELGRPTISRKPHYAVQGDHTIKTGKVIEVSTKEGKIDQSEGEGEIDYYEPKNAQGYIEMPKQLDRIEKGIEALGQNMGRMANAMEKQGKLFQKAFMPKKPEGDNGYIG